MDNKQYNALFSFIWNIANDVLVHAFENEDTSVKPIPVGTGGGKPQPEMDALSSIVKDFNDTYETSNGKIVMRYSVRLRNCQLALLPVLISSMLSAMATSK
jgi:hypothetical protein